MRSEIPTRHGPIAAVAFAIRYSDGMVETAIAEGKQRIDVNMKTTVLDSEPPNMQLTLSTTNLVWHRQYPGTEERAIDDGREVGSD